MDLEESSIDFRLPEDKRPRIPEPLPIWLVAIDDVRLPAPIDIRGELDEFYVAVLGCAPDESADGDIVYRTDNLRLRFIPIQGLIERQTLRPTVLEVPSLALAERAIFEREIEYTRDRATTPGRDSLILLDPAGNWIELIERKLLL